MDKNPKFEYRNPKQSLTSNDQIFKTCHFQFSILSFGHLKLFQIDPFWMLRPDFVLRI